MFGRKQKTEVSKEQPIYMKETIKITEQPQTQPQIQQQPIQQEQIIQIDRESEGLIVQLRQVCRRLLEIEQQILNKSVKERDENTIGGLKSFGSLLNEAEALQLIKGDLIHQLQQKNVSDNELNGFIQGALAGIQGYVPEFVGGKQ